MSRRINNHPFHTGNEEKLAKSMTRGQKYTIRQINHIFKLRNPAASVARLIDKGYDVKRSYKYVAHRGYVVTYSI